MHSSSSRNANAPVLKGEPLTLTLSDAERCSGLSRVTLYRLNADGRLIFRKAGRKTLVDYQSLARCLQSLPEIRVMTGGKSADAA
jgi:hypothetical protein